MKNWEVTVTKEFKEKLTQIILYIAQDKPQAARKFRKEILLRIKELSSMPYRNRESIYSNDQNVRDLIFKGYTVIYEIGDDKVVVFSIINHQIQF